MWENINCKDSGSYSFASTDWSQSNDPSTFSTMAHDGMNVNKRHLLLLGPLPLLAVTSSTVRDDFFGVETVGSNKIIKGLD